MNYSTFHNDPTLDNLWLPNHNLQEMTINDIYKSGFLVTNNKKTIKNATNVMKKLDMNGELGKTFFSAKNISRIQKAIKKEIFIKTKGKYKLDTEQDTKDLFIVMKSIYLTNAKYVPGQIVRQVKKLNKIVVDQVVPDMIATIGQYYKYLDDINKPIVPKLNLPANTRPSHSLPSVTSILHS